MKYIILLGFFFFSAFSFSQNSCFSEVGLNVRLSQEIAGNFELGFQEGYRIIQGDLSLVPLTPVQPVTPLGSTPFREGIKKGMNAATGVELF